MDRVTPLFQYDPFHRVLVCEVCGDVLGREQCRAHLNRPVHKAAKAGERLGRRRLWWLLKNDWSAVIDRFKLPREPVRPFRGLPVYRDGLRCDQEGCGFVSRYRKYIDEHRNCHIPINSGSTAGHLCQRVLSKGPGGRHGAGGMYVAVLANSEGASNEAVQEGSD